MKDMNGQTILLISDMRQVYLAEILTKKGDECTLPGHQKQSDSRRTAFKIKKISCRGGNAGASDPGNQSSRAGAAE